MVLLEATAATWLSGQGCAAGVAAAVVAGAVAAAMQERKAAPVDCAAFVFVPVTAQAVPRLLAEKLPDLEVEAPAPGKLIGKGLFSEVYLAGTGRVLRVPHDGILGRAATVRQITEEALVTARIGKHRNLVPILGWCILGGLPATLHPLCEGPNLVQYLREDKGWRACPWLVAAADVAKFLVHRGHALWDTHATDLVMMPQGDFRVLDWAMTPNDMHGNLKRLPPKYRIGGPERARRLVWTPQHQVVEEVNAWVLGLLALISRLASSPITRPVASGLAEASGPMPEDAVMQLRPDAVRMVLRNVLAMELRLSFRDLHDAAEQWAENLR